MTQPSALPRKSRPSISMLARLKRAYQMRMARINPSPIFVLGNQKSGTTVIAALLGQRTGKSVALDLTREIKKPVYDRVRSGEISFSKFVRMNRLDFSRDIVKEPSLSMFYPELAAHFPQARFVMVMRDPRDNIRSILNRLKIAGDLPRLEPELWARVKPAWKLILDGRWLGLSGENYIEMLAARWNLIAETYLNHREKMVFIRYEDFLKNKAEEVERLATQLDLPRLCDIADKVDVQYQSRGNREVKWEDFFGEKNLRQIERVCQDRMKALDYF